MNINDKKIYKEHNGKIYERKLDCELYNDNFENAKRYNIPPRSINYCGYSL